MSTTSLASVAAWEPSAALSFVIGSVATGLGLYLALSIWFQLRYYKKRGAAHEVTQWKCQPQRFPSARMFRIDLWLGVANITFGSVLSGLLAYWIYSSGRSRMYMTLEQHSLLEAIVATVAYFVITDGIIYWAHRIFHRPTFFRLIHRWHHRNTTPTAFTAFSMHPVEFLTYQSVMLLPLIFLPLPIPGVIAVLLLSHLESLVQHSGVRLFPWLPWMPSTYFHDDHHRYFHANYGQHLVLWDRIFGSLRRHGRRYGIDVFGGAGAPMEGGKKEAVCFVDYGRKSRFRVEGQDAPRQHRAA
jgi:lathosterol oxidase